MFISLQDGLLSSLTTLSSITLARNAFSSFPSGGPAQFCSVVVSIVWGPRPAVLCCGKYCLVAQLCSVVVSIVWGPRPVLFCCGKYCLVVSIVDCKNQTILGFAYEFSFFSFLYCLLFCVSENRF